eukprot:1149744-Pelagomonas_calceolata.AAC.6
MELEHECCLQSPHPAFTPRVHYTFPESHPPSSALLLAKLRTQRQLPLQNPTVLQDPTVLGPKGSFPNRTLLS